MKISGKTKDEVYLDTLAKLDTTARAERNGKLAACDWTQVADAPVDKKAWAEYRQALRDLTDQAGWPSDIKWPVEP
jgi:hypothetical protein